jgi:membrane protease subunit (stomatin/prohibitin family)
MAFLGIGLVAMPTGIISAGFLQKISEIKETQKSDNKIKDNKSTKTEDENPDTSNDETEENANESCKHDTTDDNGKKHYCPYCGHRLD